MSRWLRRDSFTLYTIMLMIIVEGDYIGMDTGYEECDFCHQKLKREFPMGQYFIDSYHGSGA